MPMYRCPECSLVMELSNKQAQGATACVQCGSSFEPQLHPIGNLHHPSRLSGQGKEQLSFIDLIATYIVVLGPLIAIGVVLFILGLIILIGSL